MEEAIRALLETMPLAEPPFEAYKPLIVDGLVYFIMRLPADRLNAIAAEQMTMGEASSNERIVALLRHCPTLHKLGQVVSHERGLPQDFRDRLQFLESLPPVGDLAPVVERIRAEIGEIEGLEIASEALAQGSVAIVVPFTLTTHGRTKQGVFKVLLPGVEQRLEQDLAIWPELAGLLEERSNFYGLPPLDYRGFLEGVGRLLRDEIRLDREQRQLVKAAAFYARTPGVVVPKIFPFSTPAVTAMDRIEGEKVTTAKNRLSEPERRKLAETIVNALLAKPFWRGGKRSLFHADPHAGNLLLTPDGKLAILDWALTTILDKRQLSSVVQGLVCATTLDEAGLYKSIANLGTVMDEPAVRAGVASAMAEIRTGRVPGFTWMVSLLDILARQGSMNFDEEAVLFRKAVLTMTGVVADVWNGASVDSVVVATGAMQFVREAPLRALVPIGSRRLGTHLSTWDLMLYWASLPWAPARFLYEGARDGFTRVGATTVSAVAGVADAIDAAIPETPVNTSAVNGAASPSNGTPSEAPQAEQSFAPQAEHDAAPQAEHDAEPKAEQSAAPQAEHDAAPEAEHDAAPEAEQSAAPQAKGDASPQAEHDAAPQGVRMPDVHAELPAELDEDARPEHLPATGHIELSPT